MLIGLTAGGADALKSGVGDTFVGGKPQGYSRRTYTHAINGPVGVMTETLYQILDDRKIGHQASIPIDIRSRIENALSTLGEGEDHAVCETTSRLTWLYYLDPNWVKLRIIPFFALTNDQAEPAWNGFLHNQRLGDTELFALLKPNFLRLFEVVQNWRWDSQPIDRLHQFLVLACYWNTQSNQYVNFSEARLALQRSTDDGRSEALSFLNSIIADQDVWDSFGRTFIAKAWPRETAYQTPQTSQRFAAIAENSGIHFPDVVQNIFPLLVPTTRLDLFVYRARERDDGERASADLPRKFPNDMVALLDRLVPEDPALAPYDLGGLVKLSRRLTRLCGRMRGGGG
ncbi:hypothetical protein IVB18_47220 [Bradyrhizobium sp. 186]|uniref:hypothetical protein n=1 Tax=Bradyrhizobium sp. 186 TaxID=2782654 RepID=UPI002000CF16|nr:hypothetical protein [Bradyrhizobium sp. 186]UPK35458.1 hypothetical protein IVB18_47220 [Bradyrhizobium sp. 186]